MILKILVLQGKRKNNDKICRFNGNWGPYVLPVVILVFILWRLLKCLKQRMMTKWHH